MASFVFEQGEVEYAVTPFRQGSRVRLAIDGQLVDVRLERGEGETCRLWLDGVEEPVLVACAGDRTFVHLRGKSFEVTRLDPIARLREARASEEGRSLRAPMPGVVVELRAREGDEVASGDTLLVIESMKLQTAIVANVTGRVSELPLAVGQSFEKGALLAHIESRKEEPA